MAFTNPNKRIFYATKGVALGDHQASGVVDAWGTSTGGTFDGSGKMIVMHGVQSLGITSNYPLEAVFEFGQLSLYENVEDIPEVEITIQKFLDGYTLLYHAASVRGTDPTLIGRQNARSDLRMIIGLDTDSAVSSGDSLAAEVYGSGMYWGNISYSLPTDGQFTEDLTLTGNNLYWITSDTGSVLLGAGGTVHNVFNFGNDSPDSPSSGVLRRQNVVMGTGQKNFGGNIFVTVLPDFIDGITNNATGLGQNGASSFVNCGSVDTDSVHIQSINFTINASREAINQLGSFAPFHRYLNFPVEVTTEIEVATTRGANVNVLETSPRNKNHSTQVVLDDSTVFQVGNKNKLTSVTFGGGDTGGANDTVTYSMSNNNDFVILHSGDPMALETSNYFKWWYA